MLKDSDSILRVMIEANSEESCVGVIAWMHTFSPGKMWIRGLDALAKPLLHFHTQASEALPWSMRGYSGVLLGHRLRSLRRVPIKPPSCRVPGCRRKPRALFAQGSMRRIRRSARRRSSWRCRIRGSYFVPLKGLSHESAGPHTINNLAVIGLMGLSPSLSMRLGRKIMGFATTLIDRRPRTSTRFMIRSL